MQKWQESYVFHMVCDVRHFDFFLEWDCSKARNPKVAGDFDFLFSSSVKDA